MSKWYTAARRSSPFVLLVMWRFWEGTTEEEINKPEYMVMYGYHDWPSQSEWIVPQ